MADIIDRAALRRLLAAATKRPWECSIAGIEGDSYVAGTGPWHRAMVGFGPFEETKAENDADLIVAACNAIEPLLDALDAAEAREAVLREFVRSVAVIEWIKTDAKGETCGYCGCDATEENGPIACHAEHCLQVRSRQVLASVARLDGKDVRP